MIKCTKCGSHAIRIDKCRCGIPCMVFCENCNRYDHDNPSKPPHKKQPKDDKPLDEIIKGYLDADKTD